MPRLRKHRAARTVGAGRRQQAGAPRVPLLSEVKDAVTPRATLLVIGVVVLQLLFIASCVGALHDPRLKDVPFGVTAPQVAAEQAVTRLKQIPGTPLDPRALPDEATARRQILNRDIGGSGDRPGRHHRHTPRRLRRRHRPSQTR